MKQAPRGLPPIERVEWYGTTLSGDGCLEFDGPRHSKGYGYITVAGRSTLVHRVVFEHHTRALIDDEVVRHTCDNPPCVNPEHLIPGTRADNNRDARERGRHRAPKGEAHPDAKLTASQVEAIRSRYMGRGGPTQQELAEEFGVTQGNISHILTGRNWREAA